MNSKKSILNDQSKHITRLNKNYFFATTLLIVLINILFYAFRVTNDLDFEVRPVWGGFSWANLWQALINTYTHFTWQHCLLNMLCFLIAGAYLERKQGTLLFFVFMITLSFFTAFASCTSYSLSWRGFSGANYGLYSYIIIDYLFLLLQKNKRTRSNIIAGAVMLGLIYFAMCFCGGTSSVSFTWYPYDLLHNLGHASGFFVGIIFGFYTTFASFVQEHGSKTSE